MVKSKTLPEQVMDAAISTRFEIEMKHSGSKRAKVIETIQNGLANDCPKSTICLTGLVRQECIDQWKALTYKFDNQ
jgi:hypothetical protein